MAIFVLKGDVKLELTNYSIHQSCLYMWKGQKCSYCSTKPNRCRSYPEFTLLLPLYYRCNEVDI